MRAPFVTECLGELAKGTLRGSISRDGEATLECQQRTKIDDLSPPKWHHVPARRLR
jgi:hypothetical protein